VRPAAADLSAGASADLSVAVRAAQAGSQEAFRVLYREVQPGLLRYLRGLLANNPDDAEDLASETWLHIARDIHTFRDEGAGFRGWAARIARHRALDHLRHTQRRPATTLPTDTLHDLPDPHDTAQTALDLTTTNATIALIATLPRDQAEAVLLRVVVGLDTNATARVMGKRPGAVRTAAWRGLRRLATQLDHPTPATTEPGVTHTARTTPRRSR
jgi:RNA polymerase sigma-70 factor (ECF subfamily)